MIETLGCVDPKQVDDADYLAYLNHDGRSEFEAHLATCPFCQREVELYRKQDRAMRRNFNFIISSERPFCTETHKLGEYSLGLLSLLEKRELEAHLNSCQFCSEELNNLQSWLPEAELVPTTSQPGAKQFVERDQPEPFLVRLRRVVATLLSIGLPQGDLALAGGLRGSLDGAPQIFEAEEVQITITVQPAGPRRADLKVEGLVQRAAHDLAELEGVPVRLLKGTELLATEQIDDIGNFVFESVAPSDKFDLEITLEDKVVLVPDVSTN